VGDVCKLLQAYIVAHNICFTHASLLSLVPLSFIHFHNSAYVWICIHMLQTDGYEDAQGEEEEPFGFGMSI
jgi:hypothetical protein